MEPKIEHLAARINDAVTEVKTLYDISEAEMVLLTHVIMNSSSMGVSMKLTAKILKAAAHFLELNEDIQTEFVKLYKENS